MTKKQIKAKFADRIADWYDMPEGECDGYKYDIMLARGWSYREFSHYCDCQGIETFATLRDVIDGLKQAFEVKAEVCAACPKFINGECQK